MRGRAPHQERGTRNESPSTLDTRRSTLVRGFTYVGLLIAVALIGVGLAVTGQVWRTAVQREKERELLFVGDQIRRAITQYYESTPGTGKQFPKKLEDMLRDDRYPTTRRYLRKVYRDPMTGNREWGIVKGPGDTIMGVYSLSKLAPFKRANFPPDYEPFTTAVDYSEWKFAFAGGGSPQASPAPALTQPTSQPIPTSALTGQPVPLPAQAPVAAGGMGAGGGKP